jgi:hypothetical protein
MKKSSPTETTIDPKVRRTLNPPSKPLVLAPGGSTGWPLSTFFLVQTLFSLCALISRFPPAAVVDPSPLARSPKIGPPSARTPVNHRTDFSSFACQPAPPPARAGGAATRRASACPLAHPRLSLFCLSAFPCNVPARRMQGVDFSLHFFY